MWFVYEMDRGYLIENPDVGDGKVWFGNLKEALTNFTKEYGIKFKSCTWFYENHKIDATTISKFVKEASAL